MAGLPTRDLQIDNTHPRNQNGVSLGERGSNVPELKLKMPEVRALIIFLF